MFSKLRNALVGLLVIAASTVAVTVSNSPVSATGTVAPSAVASSLSIGAQNVPTWTNTNIISITAGSEHTCAIQGSTPSATTGSVFCWGKARSIGDGTSNNANVPVLVASNDGFVNTAVSKVEAGGDTTCAIEAGSLWCWGGAGGFAGSLGNGTLNSSNVPIKVLANGSGAEAFSNNGNVTDVDASFARTCAIESGKVFCWGYENDALGLGGQSASPSANVPNRVADSATPGFRAATATKLHMGFNFHCAVAGGQLWCWGFGSSGELGDGGTGSSNRPKLVGNSTPGTEFTNASLSSAFMGDSHGCAIVSGTLSCWGRGANGRLGNGGTTDQLLPAAVQAGGGFVNNTSAVTSGAATDKHTCAVESGRLYCWGLNSDGRLGDGTSTASNVPVLVSPSVVTGFTNTGTGTGVVTAVAAGTSGGSNAHTCAIENKVAYCWGGYGVGQLGMGAQTGPGSNKPVKVFVVSAPAAPTISVSAGQSGSLNVGVSKPNDGGSTITSYEYSVDNGSPAAVAFDGSNYQTITISGLTNGTQYSVKVRAVNAIGAGDWSAATNSTPSSGGGGGVGGGSGGGTCTGGALVGTNNLMLSGAVNSPVSLNMPNISSASSAMTYSLLSGTLPAGLSLNTTSGLISGTPTAAANGTATVRATNGTQTCDFILSISIYAGGGGMPTCTTGAPGVRGTNPTLDSTFGTAGAIAFTVDGGTTALRSGVATADGNFVVAESRYSNSSVTNLRKYTPAGALVSSFGTDGVLTIDKATGSTSENVYAMRELSDGSLAVLYSVVPASGPRPIYIAKVTSAGAIDTSWATAGFAEVANAVGVNAREMKLLSDGAMLVFMSSASGMVVTNGLVKVLPNGSVDSSFGTAGTLSLPESEFSFDVSGSDAIFVGGGSSATPNDATIRKFSSAGVLDTSWGSGGTLTLPRIGAQGDDNFVNDVAVMANGKMYVAVMAASMQSPSSTSVLLRLLADGTIDSSFGDGTTLPSTIMNVDDILVLRDGNILVTAMSGMYTPEMGVGLVSASGELDSAFADELAVMQFGDCPLSDMMVVQTTTGEVFGVGSKYGLNTQGSLWKLVFSGVTNNAANTETPSTTETPAVPTLVTSANAAALVRAPGSESIIINGQEVVIESNNVNIPAARTPASQRTAAQVASIQQAGAALLQQFLASLPAGATSNVAVVNTSTGAVMQNLVFDANGNSVDVPVEDIVFLDGPQLSLMIGSNNANITADGKYQVGAGGIVGVTGSGLGTSADGEIVAMSTPTLLANFQTTAAGDFNKSATLPSSIGVGDHTLVVATGTTYAMMGIRVVPAALPTTGSSTENVVIIALFTLVFGALFFRGRRINLI